MATQFWIHDGSFFRKARELWVKDATNWRKAKEVWAHDGTAFRKVFQSFSPVLNVDYYSFVQAWFDSEYGDPQLAAKCGVRLNTDGSGVAYQQVQNPAGQGGSWSAETTQAKNWGDPVTSAIGLYYYARLRMSSGDNPQYGNAINTWVSLANNLYWEWYGTTYVARQGYFYIDISGDGGSTYITSAFSMAQVYWYDIVYGP